MNIWNDNKKMKMILGVIFLLFGVFVFLTGIQSINNKHYSISVFLFVFFIIVELIGLLFFVTVPNSIHYDDEGIHYIYKKKIVRDVLWDSYKYAFLKMNRKGNLTIVLSPVRIKKNNKITAKMIRNNSMFVHTIGPMFLSSKDGYALLCFIKSKYNASL